ncbi:phospholipase D-like domain-containing protein [Kaistella sp. BT6-1-3]|jgi:hypothetical protein|uniref:Phospholipase D-like domain-containing protein n=1 Tax=Kaistella yananensis TaxID=2989820 RepID=A0ABT3JPP2_9FLAO|nr:phospholipase D-like domain-containing protein [Kaistella yananensis]MCW4452742.1 phospholipase D-like domain-containing protein [Kaistella yananensis]
MAEFLNKKKLLEWVPKLIETAGKELVIISPYIQISEKIFKLLKESEKRGVEITLIYKEGELSEKERKKFDEIENLNLLYQPNLHSKCIYNEKYLLVTSMNLYDFRRSIIVKWVFCSEEQMKMTQVGTTTEIREMTKVSSKMLLKKLNRS